jgi:hypothetical protein
MARLGSSVRGAMDRQAPPLRSVSELVESYGGARRGGVQRAASDIGVSPRAVERWLRYETGAGGETRQPPTQRTKGLTAEGKRQAGRIRQLGESRERRRAGLIRRARGGKVSMRYRAAFRPYRKRHTWTMPEPNEIALPPRVLEEIASGEMGEALADIEYEMVAEELGGALAASGETEVDVLELDLEVE